MAVRAARVLGLGVAGVDLIRSRRGPLVLEVNSSPGLEGIEQATGVDIAGAIIDHVAAADAGHAAGQAGQAGPDAGINEKITAGLTAA